MIVSGWFGRLSGTLGVICGIVSLFWDNAIAKLAFYIAAALGLLLAAYGGWKAEREQHLASEGRGRPMPQPLLSVVLKDRHGIGARFAGFHVRNVGRPALDLTIDDVAVGVMVATFQTVPDVLAPVDGGIERVIPFCVGQTDDEHVSYGENIEVLFLSHPPEVIYRVAVVLRYWDVDRQRRYKSVFNVEIDAVSQEASTTFVSQVVDNYLRLPNGLALSRRSLRHRMGCCRELTSEPGSAIWSRWLLAIRLCPSVADQEGKSGHGITAATAYGAAAPGSFWHLCLHPRPAPGARLRSSPSRGTLPP